MDTDPAAPSPVPPAVFDHARAALADSPAAAADRLVADLRAARDYHHLFYALLLRKRVELGVTPFPTGPSADLPADTHAPYEDGIRQAAREVGGLYLKDGDIARAWGFFRLIGEPEPVRQALAACDPGPDDDTYPLVEIAWHQQVFPEKGFDLILDRHGVCSAITLVSSADLSTQPALRTHCVRRLVRTLHAQLLERLRADREGRGLPAAGSTVAEQLAGPVDLLADDAYHVDVSHLSSVVQMAIQLPPGEELELARELCEYGRRLAPQFRGDADAPFEDTYADYAVYLDVLAGRDADAGLAHFRGKIAREKEEGNMRPAEVLIDLLLRLDRPADALAVAREWLADVDERAVSCPGVTELARRVGDFAAVAEAAKAKGDPVTYLAGLIAGR